MNSNDSVGDSSYNLSEVNAGNDSPLNNMNTCPTPTNNNQAMKFLNAF